MSVLDTLGGLSAGLGGSGGVGGSIPSNQSAANSAASAAINPTITVGGTGGGYQSVGNFEIQFPPTVQTQGRDSVNAPPMLSGLSQNTIILLGAGLLILGMFIIKKG